MKKFLIAVSLLSLAACATEAEHHRYALSHIGMSEDDLVTEMGVPDKRHSTKDKKYFEYKESKATKLLRTKLFCNTTYILRNNMVEDVTFRGNYCVRSPKLL